MRPLLLALLIILAIPFYTGNGELEKVRVVDSTGIYEGKFVRSWDESNVLYDKKWGRVHGFNYHGKWEFGKCIDCD